MDKNKNRLILGQYKSIEQQTKEIQKKLSDVMDKKVSIAGVPYARMSVGLELTNVENDAHHEALALVNSYMDNKKEIEQALGIKLSDVNTITKSGFNVEASILLRELQIECNKVIYYLESLESNLSSQDSDKLNHIRKELTEVCEGLDTNFERNMEKAIIEAETGHSLACALITSRVIEVMLDKFVGKNIGEKIDYLISKDLIDSGRQDVKESVIRASKRSRDFLSHRIEIFAESSDALSLLGDAVNILKIYKKVVS